MNNNLIIDLIQNNLNISLDKIDIDQHYYNKNESLSDIKKKKLVFI